MSDNLPDEIISEILSPALKVSETLFSDTSLESPFATFLSSSSSTLLVCKSWLRVATPLLYSFVVIRSKAQANAFQATLRGNPDLGRFVKNLRVEGGFGKSMHHILKKTPNINHLVLCLHLRAADSTDGLAEGLSLINPTRLTIIDEIELFLNNRGVTKLMRAIEGSLQKWNRLNEVNLPYTQSTSSRESFCLTVCTSLTVTTVSFPNYNSSLVATLVKIAQNPSIKAIDIRPESQQKPPREELNRRLRLKRPPRPPPQVTDPRLRALIRWPNVSIGGPDTETSKAVSSVPKNPSFRPMALTPPEIWARILFFAMLSLEQHPTNVELSQLIDRKINSARLQFLFVSHSFQQLASPYLYQYPVFPNELILASFASAVVANPTLGKHVQLLDLRFPNRRHSLNTRARAVPSLQASLHLILPHTCNLRRLISTSNTISWGDFTTLAATAGSTLQEFTGLAFTFPREDTVLSPAVFNHFVALKKFRWKCGFHSNKITSRQVDTVSAAVLPTLEFLDIRTPEALSVFAKMKLPKLQRIALANEQKGYGQDDQEWHNNAILTAHGRKIQHLEVVDTTIDNKSVFSLCPHMTTLSWQQKFQHNGQYNLGCTASHAALTKIILMKEYTGLTIKKSDEDWGKSFSALDVPHLSALREISVPSCEWPKTDHDIAKSVWVKWAEFFLDRGIKVTDKDGNEWRPRLKTSRRR